MTSVWIEMRCPQHGLERFEIKIIKKYNVSPDLIEPKFRTRPKPDLSGIVVGKNVGYDQIKDYLARYFYETGLMNNIISMRLRV
ncbi:MAG: hypothetical protein K6T73_07530 [Candidatus Bathyarchaeota archaeon]|nr:hypothetical protein [Candidatus Bathyarchaeota archaeon]